MNFFTAVPALEERALTPLGLQILKIALKREQSLVPADRTSLIRLCNGTPSDSTDAITALEHSGHMQLFGHNSHNQVFRVTDKGRAALGAT